MKRYFLKFALLALSAGTLISCDEETVTYGGKNFVSFDKVASTKFTFFEHKGISEVPVNIAFAKSNDVTINFTVTTDAGGAVEGVDYNILTPGSITIPAGSTSANIRIEVINNEVMNDSKYLYITLTGVNDGSVSLGLADQGSKYKRFLIVNDDCTTNFLEFFGKYDVKRTDNGVLIGTAEADVNETGDCNILMISGTLDSVLETTVASPLEFTFVPGGGGNKNVGTLSAVEQLYCEKCLTDDDGNEQSFLFSGGGTFNTGLTGGQKRLVISGTMRTISTLYPGISTSVTLTPAN